MVVSPTASMTEPLAGESPRSSLRRRAGSFYATDKYEGGNPFISKTPLGCYEVCKMVFFTITFIAPLRLILFIITFISMAFWGWVATLCRGQTDEPLRGCRWLLTLPMRLLCRILLLIIGVYWVRVDGCCSAGRGARIIVSNHIALWDHCYHCYWLGASVMGKAELWGIPLIGAIARGLQCVPVDRQGGAAAALQTIKHRAETEHFPPLLIFPQGTTTRWDVLSQFKRGAFEPGVPVQPVALRYSACHNDMFLGDSVVLTIYRDMCQVYNCMSVTYLPVHTPSAEEKGNANQYGSNVRDTIAAALGAQKTQHSFDDFRFRSLAQKLRITGADELIVDDLYSRFSIRYTQLQQHAREFAALDLNRSGLLDLAEFRAALQGTGFTDAVAARLFRLFDTHNTGSIGFEEYVVARQVVSEDATGHEGELLRVVFELCNFDDRGYATGDALLEVAGLTGMGDELRAAAAAVPGDAPRAPFTAALRPHVAGCRRMVSALLAMRVAGQSATSDAQLPDK